DMATEVDADEPKTFEQVIEEKFAEKPTAKEYPPEVVTLSSEGVYPIHTKQGLEDFIADQNHWDKPVIVKFANNKACDPCKALRPNYLLSAKFLADKAYFVEVEENEFDDLGYFDQIAPRIPAFIIYKNG